MDKLYQNCLICVRIFSSDNPNRICKINSRICNVCGYLLSGLLLLLLIASIYFGIIGMGFLTSYIFNHESYDVISGCKLNDPNCTKSELFCSGKTSDSIFGLCLIGGVVSTCALIGGLIIGIPILYYVIVGIVYVISSIIGDILESFDKTKESMTIPKLSSLDNDNIELESNSINLTTDEIEPKNNEFSSISLT